MLKTKVGDITIETIKISSRIVGDSSLLINSITRRTHEISGEVKTNLWHSYSQAIDGHESLVKIEKKNLNKIL